jgi:hypothetical protein
MHNLAVALHFGIYKFVRQYQRLGTTPAVGAGLEERPWSLEQVVEMTEAYWLAKRRQNESAPTSLMEVGKIGAHTPGEICSRDADDARIVRPA